MDVMVDGHYRELSVDAKCPNHAAPTDTNLAREIGPSSRLDQQYSGFGASHLRDPGQSYSVHVTRATA